MEQADRAIPHHVRQTRRTGPLARDFLEQALAEAVQSLEMSLAAFRERPDAEAVHALRIAARKLRGTVVLIGRIAPNDHLTRLSEHARTVAKALAGAREADVLKQGFEHLCGRKQEAKGHIEFATVLAKRQERSYRQAIAAVAEIGVIHLASMTRRLDGASRQRLRALDNMSRRDAHAPARDIAVRLMDELAERVVKKSRLLRRMGDRKRHKLRIAVKNLRYGAELFSPLFESDSRLARYLSRLGRLQDELGTCNDAVAAKRQVIAILHGQGRPVRKAARDFLAAVKARKKKSATKLKRRVKRLKRAAPFWRS